jgi:uncharacterized membrane protein YvbJ
MKNCSKCNNANNDDAKFCKFCGNKFEEIQVNQEQINPEQVYTEIDTNKRKRRLHIVFIVLGAVCIIATALVIAISIGYTINPINNIEKTDFQKLAIYHTGMTEEGEKIFLAGNPQEISKDTIFKHCPVSSDTNDGWLYIGCFNNGKILITKTTPYGEKTIDGALNDTEYRAVVYSTLQSVYNHFSEEEKQSVNDIIDYTWSDTSDYVKGNVEGSILENDGNLYQDKFANIGAWDSKVSSSLEYYFSKYFDLKKIQSLYDVTDLKSSIDDTYEKCFPKGKYNSKLKGCEGYGNTLKAYPFINMVMSKQFEKGTESTRPII